MGFFDGAQLFPRGDIRIRFGGSAGEYSGAFPRPEGYQPLSPASSLIPKLECISEGPLVIQSPHWPSEEKLLFKLQVQGPSQRLPSRLLKACPPAKLDYSLKMGLHA